MPAGIIVAALDDARSAHPSAARLRRATVMGAWGALGVVLLILGLLWASVAVGRSPPSAIGGGIEFVAGFVAIAPAICVLPLPFGALLGGLVAMVRMPDDQPLDNALRQVLWLSWMITWRALVLASVGVAIGYLVMLMWAAIAEF